MNESHRVFLQTDSTVVFAYEYYFKLPYNTSVYAPPIACITCCRALRGWRNHENRFLDFKLPMIWMEPIERVHNPNNCYYCVNIKNNVRTITYTYTYAKRYEMNISAVASVLMTVQRTPEDILPVPPPLRHNIRFTYHPLSQTITEEDFYGFDQPSTSAQSVAIHSEYLPPPEQKVEKHTITIDDFDDLCRDFKIPIYLSEDLLSRFKNWNLITTEVTIEHVRNRHHELDKFFNTHESLVYCCDIFGLFERFSYPHNPDEWTLFIDASTESKLNMIFPILFTPIHTHVIFVSRFKSRPASQTKKISCCSDRIFYGNE